MKYCEKCGKELSDDAAICMGCGCPTGYDEHQKQVKEKKKFGIKKILLIIAIVAAVIGVAIAGMFVWRHIRTERVKDQLAGKKFEYRSSSLYSYTHRYYAFDEESNCTYYYKYTHMDEGKENERDYKITFKNGNVFIESFIDILEVQYDSYGNITALYDISTKELYD